MSENIAAKTVILNNIFDILIETTGIHHGKYMEMHRAEFLSIQLREEHSFASEYWFPAEASDNMKLLFSSFGGGFSVITQNRTAKGVLAAANADSRFKAMGYSN